MTNTLSSNQPHRQSKAAFIALLLIAFLLPWPRGGEQVWEYLPFAGAIFAVLAMCLFKQSVKKQSAKNKNHSSNNLTVLQPIKLPLILLLAWLVYGFIQIIPLPFNLPSSQYNASLSLLTPSADTSTDISNNINDTVNSWQTISIAPNITFIENLKNGSYLALFVLSFLLINSKKRLKTTAQTLFFSSALMAIYSLINHYTNGSYSLLDSIPPWTTPWDRAAHGTFSYQNHYASFLTITIPLGFALMFEHYKTNKSTHLTQTRLAKTIDFITSKNGVYLLATVLMILALFKTASRGGNAIFIISLILTAFCTIISQPGKKTHKVKKLLGFISVLLIIAITATLTGAPERLTNRLDKQGFEPSGRTLMYQTTSAIIASSPILGTGAGTYPIVQHQYKTPLLGITAMSKRAHNDYLELLCNQGIIGFGLLGSATLLLFISLCRGLSAGLSKGRVKEVSKENSSSSNKTHRLYGFQVASFWSITAILLHSFADFNFHLPVNTVYFFILLTIGLKANLLKR